ncbi:hypothetical protein GCM10010503_62780 [Streptomyces lucensis JCM 4490]|uniref:AG2 protein n=1 Tax=Streptomyces lucensis JCM 4490 TaxID=1306176 RepID=A0A918MVE0_9ACTN|nr:hypothetical protein [Streptomyces lucensis]GGW76433.1 hypothetical protein GCM10010503_62780 [Streptomyces lucensis JCM 4490]
MPTYHEIMSTDLGALTSAAERWEGMAAEFGKQEKAYRRDVHGISTGATWSGMSAEAAHGRFGVTLTEFQYAQTEAKAIAALLRDAHTQFTGLKGRLTTARKEAVAAGMRVSDRGLVSADPAHAKERDEATVRSWQDRIDAAVRAVTDADTGVETALKAAVVDSGPLVGGRGFNGRAMGDVEKYEALAAEDALRRLSRGEHLSRRELAELERTFRDNSHDEAFSRTLLDDLGAAGTITLTNELNDLIHVKGGPGTGTYSTIESGLADTLATATRDTDSAWYRHWRTSMRHAGTAHYATDAQGERLDKAVGYQSLVTLMGKGHGYSPAMLENLTDDMIAAERRDPGIWRLKGEYSGRHGGWFANDPVDGALGIMSRDPHTAADYLDSDARMRYLVKDRDWNVVLHEHEGLKTSTYAAGLDKDDRAGFGRALQAATTGIDPSDRHAHYVAHSQQNEAVLRSAMSHLSESGDKFPPSLRQPMASILVNHGGTVHASMSEIDISKSPLKQDELFEVAKQVSKDKDAYGTLNGGLNQAMVSAIHSDHSHSAESLTRAGRTVGFLEEARNQAAGAPKGAQFESKPLFDKAISYIPVAGDDVQAGFDYVTARWLADEQKRIDDQRADDNIEDYSKRNGQLMALSAEWGKGHRVVTPYFDPKEEITQSARFGATHASGMSGEQPK